MPALPAAPKTLRVSLAYLVAGQTTFDINRFHLAYTGTPPTLAEASAFAGAVNAAWSSHMKSAHSTALSLVNVEVVDLDSSTGAVGINNTVITGTDASGSVQAATCLVVKRRIARRYRGGHSRVYLPQIGKGNLADDNTWLEIDAAGVATQWSDFEGSCCAAPWSGGGTLSSVNVSYYEGFTNVLYPSGRYRAVPTLRSGGPVIDPVVAFEPNLQVASQRRRNEQSA